MRKTDIFIHPTADVSPKATVGQGTYIWQESQVREGACLGKHCIVGKGVYIDAGVQIGDNVKIQNGVSIYHGVTLEDGVFCGPHCVFTNDKLPRAINPNQTRKAEMDWAVKATLVQLGASIGANATIICGITMGRWSMIGAGSVVVHDIPDYALVYGNPARLQGFVCPCGASLDLPAVSNEDERQLIRLICSSCGAQIGIPIASIRQLSANRRPDDPNF